MTVVSVRSGDDAASASLRDQIRSHWEDLATGRADPDAVHQWALDQLEASIADNELDIRGVQYLHGPSDDPDAVARALEQWQGEIVRFDKDPDAWMREHFQAVLLHFGKWKGVDKAGRFGRRLVRFGHLTEDDVVVVLESLAKGSECDGGRHRRSR